VAAIKVDENLPESIAVLLREAGHDVALVETSNWQAPTMIEC